MVTGLSCEAYFPTGLEVLSDLGYGELKLSEVALKWIAGQFATIARQA
jgi:hypothetical protein